MLGVRDGLAGPIGERIGQSRLGIATNHCDRLGALSRRQSLLWCFHALSPSAGIGSQDRARPDHALATSTSARTKASGAS